MRRKTWSEEEAKILIDLYPKMCTKDLIQYFNGRTEQSIKKKAESLGIKKEDNIDKELWSKEELFALETLYPIIPKQCLSNYFPNRTTNSIITKAVRMGYKKDGLVSFNSQINNLSKTKYCWTDDKNKKLIDIFATGGETEVYKSFNNSKDFLRSKMIEFNLISKTNRLKVIDLIGDTSIYKTIKHYTMVYDMILNKEIDWVDVKNLLKFNKDNVCFLFKYYHYKNRIDISKYYLLSLTYGKFLEDIKLKSIVRQHFKNYYDFICHCYPGYNFKIWEFKKLDVPNNFWDDKINRFCCIRDGINNSKLTLNLQNDCDVLCLGDDNLRKIFNPTLISKYGKNAIIEYFDFCKIDYSKYKDKIYNGIVFDSLNEKGAYIAISNFIDSDISKGSRNKASRYYNKEFREGYIPDFKITQINNIKLDKPIIIEYFGLWNKNTGTSEILINYKEKTKRKTEYFNSREDLYFIGIYPNDLKNNFKGLKEKIMSFLNNNLNIRKQINDKRA